jgi:tungstate transport system ATP-binding protein
VSQLVYELQNTTKAYEGQPVLQVNELAIERGEIFSVVGPSGAGKSTLLRLLNFLEPPTTGSILFLGQEFTASRPMPLGLRRRVTTVFQRPILLNRTVWSNVSYGLRLRGQRGRDTEIEMALEQVGLKALSGRQARTLSGGEAQRVALARAMVLQPDALLLDEPTANLDPYNVGLIEDILRVVRQEKGSTLVLVTHNIFQAKRLADRVALLLEGELIEVAPVDAFFDSPRDARTAAFVRGEMVY